MSNKRHARNINKALKALKRKQLARGGKSVSALEPKQLKAVPKPVPRELYDDSVKPIAPPKSGGIKLPIKQVKAAPQPKQVKVKNPVISDPAPKPINPSLFSDPKLGTPRDIKPVERVGSTGGRRGSSTGGSGGPINESLNFSHGVPSNMQSAALGNAPTQGLKQAVGNELRDPNGNIVDPENLPDNMVLTEGRGGKRVEFSPDYVVQPTDRAYAQRNVEQRVQQQSMPQSQQSQNVTKRSMMGSGFTGLTPAQLAKLAEDYGGGYNPDTEGTQTENGTTGTGGTTGTTASSDETDPSGSGTEETNPDGVDNGGTTPIPEGERGFKSPEYVPDGAAPINLAPYDPGVPDLKQMEAESILKPVPKAEQWANKFVDQYPEFTNAERTEMQAWAVANRAGSDAQMPAWFVGNHDFLKGIEASNSMTYDTTAQAPEGTITGEDDIQQLGDATDATSSTVEAGALTATQGDVDQADVELGDGKAKTYKATTTSGQMADTVAAQGEVSITGVAGQGTAASVDTAQRDAEAEKAAMGVAADRPAYTDYAIAAQSDERYTVIEAKDPEVAERMAQTMSEREKRDLLDIVSKEGVVLEDIPEFKLAKERVAQVGEAKSRKASEIGSVPPIDMQERQGITGEVSKGDASQIGGVPTAAAAKMDAVTGEARKTAAADMLAVVANVPKEVSAALVEDPATVIAQIDSGADPVVVAAVAALPLEALVSTQMEGLLAGMEDGNTPAWARPAIAAMEAKMAQRGLSTSTVGRDALFNAIIQSALPIAQSNAQALQTRAQQNLSNQQQANLGTAQNTMQIRLQNLANEQTSASQTADMAQQIKVQKGTFDQQAVMTTAQQKQETDLTNAQMAQQRSQQESSQRQQAAISTLGAEVQSDLANLQAMNAAGSQNMTAEQQSKLAGYNAQVSRIMRQAELDQDMTKANLSNELQLEMKNLTEANATDRESMSAVNQGRLADLNVLVDFKKTNANLSQQMDLANLNNDQQMELANLSERAATDGANMTEANRMKLQELTIYTSMMAKNEDLRQNAEMAQLSASEKVQLANLTFENQADSESMSAENTAQLQVYEKRMQAGQVNAQLAQAMGLANLSNEQSAAMFNAQINANFDMSKMSNEQQMEMANSKFMQTMTATQFSADQQSAVQNATLLTQTDLANADARTRVSVENAKNFLTMDMANLSNAQQGIVMDQQMAQQSLLSDQAAQNAAKQFGATSQNQLDSFLISQSNNMKQFNTSARNAMESFNVTETNRAAAIEAGNMLQADTFTAQLEADINKFNASIDNQRDTWNAANAQAIEQSNVSWRRQANTADTAAANASNQQNVQNAYNISALDQTQLWQQLRDEAAYVRQSFENNEQREAQLIATAIGNESATSSKDTSTTTSALINILKSYGYSGTSTTTPSGPGPWGQ